MSDYLYIFILLCLFGVLSLVYQSLHLWTLKHFFNLFLDIKVIRQPALGTQKRKTSYWMKMMNSGFSSDTCTLLMSPSMFVTVTFLQLLQLDCGIIVIQSKFSCVRCLIFSFDCCRKVTELLRTFCESKRMCTDNVSVMCIIFSGVWKVHGRTWVLFLCYDGTLGKMFLFSGQYKRSVSDVKEDATISEGAEHGELR